MCLPSLCYRSKQKELHVSMGLLPGINAAPNKSPPFAPKYRDASYSYSGVLLDAGQETWLGNPQQVVA